jgi:hypothetical protein
MLRCMRGVVDIDEVRSHKLATHHLVHRDLAERRNESGAGGSGDAPDRNIVRRLE